MPFTHDAEKFHVLWGGIECSDSEYECSHSDTESTATSQQKDDTQGKAIRLSSGRDLALLQKRSIKPEDLMWNTNEFSSDEDASQSFIIAGADQRKNKKRSRPHKHQRARYHDVREGLYQMIEQDPDGFDLESVEFPQFISKDLAGKEKLIRALESKVDMVKARRQRFAEPRQKLDELPVDVDLSMWLSAVVPYLQRVKL